MTAEEMRDAMFGHMAAMLVYWRDLEKPFVAEGQTETGARMEGLLFSLLVMFDGGSMGTPAFDIIPCPHEDDEAHCRAEGGNWWVGEIVTDEPMHEIFPWEKCR